MKIQQSSISLISIWEYLLFMIFFKIYSSSFDARKSALYFSFLWIMWKYFINNNDYKKWPPATMTILPQFSVIGFASYCFEIYLAISLYISVFMLHSSFDIVWKSVAEPGPWLGWGMGARSLFCASSCPDKNIKKTCWPQLKRKEKNLHYKHVLVWNSLPYVGLLIIDCIYGKNLIIVFHRLQG